MRDREGYVTLIGDLSIAANHVRGQYEKNRQMTIRLEEDSGPAEGSRPKVTPDEADVIAVGYTMHNYYNAVENYFLRVAKFFENNLDQPTWHRDLVDRMSVEVPNLRPRLLPREALVHFHELRAFRHVFRSLYDSELDIAKVRLANSHIPPAQEVMESSHVAFVETLGTIRDAL